MLTNVAQDAVGFLASLMSFASPFVKLLNGVLSRTPENLPEFVYTVMLKPWPLRQLTNSLLRAMVPKSVRRGPATIVLNPKDPVISGALALGVYERAEADFFLSVCEKGMCVLDIGANVGFYTAIACHAVGSSGQVIALEPDPESYRYLERTIEANRVDNVRAFQLAASDERTKKRLFLSMDNRGDNRLYDPKESWNSVEVETVTVDGLFAELGLEKVDLIKMDVQGAEGYVLGGMKGIIEQSESLLLMSEFWPLGLRQANTDPLELLVQLEGLGLELYELVDETRPKKISDKRAFVGRYPGRKYATLLGARGGGIERLSRC